jgi:hypothetical protein
MTKKAEQKEKVEKKLDRFELSKKLGKVLSEINIHGLAGHVKLASPEKISTACWQFNAKTKAFTISVNIELVDELENDELRMLLEHELLHHFRYQNCDNRNPIMTNIVLDTAINKMLYLYSPEVMSSMSDKIYFKEMTREQGLASPTILACPTLLPEEIEAIPDEKIREAYISIWGSRQTPADYDQTLPDPTELFFNLVQIISEDDASSPFGENSDEDGNGEGSDGDGEGEGSDGDESESSSSGSGKGKKSKGKNGKKQKKQKKKNRCKIVDDEDEESDGEGDDSDGSGSGKDKDDKESDDKEDSDGSGSGKGDEESDEDSDSDNSGDGDDEGDSDPDRMDEGYSDISDEVAEMDKAMSDKATGAGKGASSIQVCTSITTQINAKELERRLQELILDRTIEEISNAVIGSMGDEIVSLPYAIRPTNTTLTHIACGLNESIPLYWNHRDGNTKPKLAVYIDVSGSMSGLIPLVRSIIIKITEYLPSIVFAFDTGVAPIYTSHFADAHLCGGGTSFDTVFDHICASPEERRAWLEKFIKNWQKQLDRYDSDMRGIAVDGGMLDSEIMTDDAPAILLITDGEDRLDNHYIKKFKELNKKLIVLQFAGGWGGFNVKDSVFYPIANQLFLANSNGEIKEKLCA